MLCVIGYIFVALVVICATDGESNSKECSKSHLYREISGLRQLVNQESLYRQDLERQMRKFRRQLKAIDARLSTGVNTDTVKFQLFNLSQNLDANIENVSNMAKTFDENIAKIVKMNQRMEENQDVIIEMVSNISLNMENIKISLEKQNNGQHGTISKANCTHGFGHMGRSFAIMVPSGISGQHKPIHLVIGAESNTKITMRSSYPGMNKVFNVSPPGKIITLPAGFALKRSGSSKLQSRGIILEASQFVSVYVFHEDAYFAIPARYLGTNYKSFTTDHGQSFISIMPYGGPARVKLTSTSGPKDSIYIPELSVYHIWSANSFRNVMISSNRKVAVVTGHHKTFTNKIQTIYDSIMPIKSWNTSFIIPFIKNSSMKFDFLYSTASKRSYTAVHNSKVSQGYISQPYKFIESHKYMSNFLQSRQGTMAVVSWGYRGPLFNSFMYVVPSLSQFSSNYHFWTPSYSNNNFLVAIIMEKDMNGLRLDNSRVTKPYVLHSVSTLDKLTYKVLTISIKHGWHSVKHDDPSVRFGLIMYGGDPNVSYGLPLGLKLD